MLYFEEFIKMIRIGITADKLRTDWPRIDMRTCTVKKHFFASSM